MPTANAVTPDIAVYEGNDVRDQDRPRHPPPYLTL